MRSVVGRTLTAVVMLLALGGCAHLGGDRVDADRIYNAILQDDVVHIRSAVQSGALTVNQSISVPGYREGTPLLTVAARSASLGVIRYLLSAGADVDARTPVNETAIMLAAYFYDEDQTLNARARHDEAIRILLAAGAQLENDPHHYTPLSYAAYQGHDTAVRVLLAHGARVDADAENGSTYINTPLMMTAIQGHERTALQLLHAGANAAIRVVHGGHTAAELAAKYRHDNLFRLLRCAERHSPGRFVAQRCPGTVAAERAATHVRLEQAGR